MKEVNREHLGPATSTKRRGDEGGRPLGVKDLSKMPGKEGVVDKKRSEGGRGEPFIDITAGQGSARK